MPTPYLGLLFRYRDLRDEDNTGEIHLQIFYITKVTPCGWWYADYDHLRDEQFKKAWRWVSNSARRRHCYPTRQEAWDSYRFRKRKQLGHIQAQLECCQGINQFITNQETPPTQLDPRPENGSWPTISCPHEPTQPRTDIWRWV